ncbi:carboxymuconolactone decarboxylase family protein [Myxococcus sp. K15C18031901]|uniref:carboxymuconolactone decarboxylase family protein n=1 Tax=Myxococcus dinghuensis TaxID=2906761 RepID=UPI0020A7DF63|nr:carboxymuconolactone decarboxylase family protein [Myxococcus dinghuensis]MCP3097998.1 carboxymuconolactone decarboxylase family protein [Myxococcus dinghuensis]
MQARMKHPAMLIPDTMKALQALGASVAQGGVPQRTLELVNLRASQINGCSLCVDMHAHALEKGGESNQRIHAVGAWREAPWFTDAERAALALTEAVTRLSDTSDAVPDALWQEAARHFDERALAALLVTIAHVNLWNRLNVATRQVAGSFR